MKGYQEFRVERLKSATLKAYLFIFEKWETPVWVPISQADWDEDSSVVHISAWLVSQKPELEDILKAQDAAD